MTIARSELFEKQYQQLPAQIRRKVNRQVLHLATNLRYPGLYAKKMNGQDDVWEARVDYHHRLTFQITNNVITLRRVGLHDVLKNP